MIKDMYKILLIILLFAIVLLIVKFVIPESNSLYGNSGKLIINEVVASNYLSIKDNDGDSSDYIELYNGYKYDINLKDYYLSDKEFETDLWKFPEVVIPSKSYLVIFASGKNKFSNNELHTNFKLNKSGGVLTLTDTANSIISKIEYDRTITDTSYGYNGRNYVYYYIPTPKSKNSGETSKKGISLDIDYNGIIINEYMLDNKIFYDKSGDYHSFIELYNSTDTDISLNNLYISDDKEKLNKYKLPDIVLKKDNYLIIHASGKNTYIDEEIHTNFKVSSKDKEIVLSTSDNNIIDEVDIVELSKTTSYGLKENVWKYFTSPTPGKENTTANFESLEN